MATRADVLRLIEACERDFLIVDAAENAGYPDMAALRRLEQYAQDHNLPIGAFLSSEAGQALRRWAEGP